MKMSFINAVLVLIVAIHSSSDEDEQLLKVLHLNVGVKVKDLTVSQWILMQSQCDLVDKNQIKLIQYINKIYLLAMEHISTQVAYFVCDYMQCLHCVHTLCTHYAVYVNT